MLYEVGKEPRDKAELLSESFGHSPSSLRRCVAAVDRITFERDSMTCLQEPLLDVRQGQELDNGTRKTSLGSELQNCSGEEGGEREGWHTYSDCTY